MQVLAVACLAYRTQVQPESGFVRALLLAQTGKLAERFQVALAEVVTTGKDPRIVVTLQVGTAIQVDGVLVRRGGRLTLGAACLDQAADGPQPVVLQVELRI